MNGGLRRKRKKKKNEKNNIHLRGKLINHHEKISEKKQKKDAEGAVGSGSGYRLTDEEVRDDDANEVESSKPHPRLSAWRVADASSTVSSKTF